MTSDTSNIPTLDVSRETMDKLRCFCDLTIKWTKKINLIAPNTVHDIWNRHILDSAQLFPMAPAGWKTWVDIGSGGGFPAVIVSILASSEQAVTMVESDMRKSTFLRAAVRELSLSAHVITERVESLKTVDFDVISARALAPLDVLVGYSQSLLKPDGTAIFPKGEKYSSELNAAQQNWDFEHEALPSITNPAARILRLKRITPIGS